MRGYPMQTLQAVPGTGEDRGVTGSVRVWGKEQWRREMRYAYGYAVVGCD